MRTSLRLCKDKEAVQPAEQNLVLMLRIGSCASRLLTEEADFDTWLNGAPDDAFRLVRTYEAERMRIVQSSFEKQDLLGQLAARYLLLTLRTTKGMLISALLDPPPMERKTFVGPRARSANGENAPCYSTILGFCVTQRPVYWRVCHMTFLSAIRLRTPMPGLRFVPR